MGNLWRIIKDGLKAFVFWFIASVLLIYFFGDIGKMASALLGFVFVTVFCALRAGEILAWFLTLGSRPRQQQPPAWNPPASAPPAPPTQQQYCPRCGAQWIAGAQRCVNCG